MQKWGSHGGHAQNKKQFFFSEITKQPDPKLSKFFFYFNKIPHVLAEL